MSTELSAFLSAFFPDENEPIHFRAFKAKGAADSPLNKPAKVFATRQNLNLEKNIQRLVELNQQCGLYFVVNSGGDKDENITRFNAFFCERDDLPIAEQHRLLDVAPIQPSIRNETAKSVHAYWLLRGDCSAEEWREVQARLIAHFNSDPSIKNPSRVMRLPFFNHVSVNAEGVYQYKRVDLVLFEPHRSYTAAEMLQAFSSTIGTPTCAGNSTKVTGYQTWDALRAELGNRLRQHSTAKQNSAGNWDCQGICHNGKGDSGLVWFTISNRAHCNNGCSDSAIFQAFGLPDKPTGTQNTNVQLSTDDFIAPLTNLSTDANSDDIEAAVRQIGSHLVSCDALKREIVRDAAVKKLREFAVSSPARMFDAAMPRETATDEDSKSLDLRAPELWHEAVDGKQLLYDLVQTFERFLSAKEDLLITLSLWVIYAHAFDAFHVSPLLAITSPEKRCGKTTLLNLLDALVPKPLSVSNITPSALFRTIEKYRPTLLIDEADTFLTNDEMMRGILNSGHTRNFAYVIRSAGEDYEPQSFTTWSPKVIAMIGSLPNTVEDRSIIIRMERKHTKEVKEKLRLDRMAEFEEWRSKVARWAADHFEQLRFVDAGVPGEINNDRARDNWRVLLSIADVIGGEWAERARQVACRLAGVEPASESPRTLLLQDLKTIFDEKGETLSSEEIISALHEMENRSWAEWKNGRPLTKQGLARMLKPFGIDPDKWRVDTKTARGYHKEQFTEVFERYIGFESPHSPQDLESTTCEDNESPQDGLPVASANHSKLHKTNGVATVATPQVKVSKSALSWGEV